MIKATKFYQDKFKTGVPFARLYSYLQGTLTEQSLFSDPEGLIPLPNPVIMDNKGMSRIYLNDQFKYRFILKSADDLNIIYDKNFENLRGQFQLSEKGPDGNQGQIGDRGERGEQVIGPDGNQGQIGKSFSNVFKYSTPGNYVVDVEDGFDSIYITAVAGGGSSSGHNNEFYYSLYFNKNVTNGVLNVGPLTYTKPNNTMTFQTANSMVINKPNLLMIKKMPGSGFAGQSTYRKKLTFNPTFPVGNKLYITVGAGGSNGNGKDTTISYGHPNDANRPIITLKGGFGGLNNKGTLLSTLSNKSIQSGSETLFKINPDGSKTNIGNYTIYEDKYNLGYNSKIAIITQDFIEVVNMSNPMNDISTVKQIKYNTDGYNGGYGRPITGNYSFVNFQYPIYLYKISNTALNKALGKTTFINQRESDDFQGEKSIFDNNYINYASGFNKGILANQNNGNVNGANLTFGPFTLPTAFAVGPPFFISGDMDVDVNGNLLISNNINNNYVLTAKLKSDNTLFGEFIESFDNNLPYAISIACLNNNQTVRSFLNNGSSYLSITRIKNDETPFAAFNSFSALASNPRTSTALCKIDDTGSFAILYTSLGNGALFKFNASDTTLGNAVTISSSVDGSCIGGGTGNIVHTSGVQFGSSDSTQIYYQVSNNLNSSSPNFTALIDNQPDGTFLQTRICKLSNGNYAVTYTKNSNIMLTIFNELNVQVLAPILIAFDVYDIPYIDSSSGMKFSQYGKFHMKSSVAGGFYLYYTDINFNPIICKFKNTGEQIFKSSVANVNQSVANGLAETASNKIAIIYKDRVNYTNVIERYDILENTSNNGDTVSSVNLSGFGAGSGGDVYFKQNGSIYDHNLGKLNPILDFGNFNFIIDTPIYYVEAMNKFLTEFQVNSTDNPKAVTRNGSNVQSQSDYSNSDPFYDSLRNYYYNTSIEDGQVRFLTSPDISLYHAFNRVSIPQVTPFNTSFDGVSGAIVVEYGGIEEN